MRVVHGDIGGEVIKLIEGTPKGQSLVLVTAYFKPWHKLDVTLRNALAREVQVVFALRGGEDRDKNQKAVTAYTDLGAKVVYLERLHAKIYVGAVGALVTSMNLLESSALNSWEAGVLLERGADDSALKDLAAALAELGRLAGAEEQRIKSEHRKHGEQARLKAMVEAIVNPFKGSPSAAGFCIRCGDEITLDPKRPHCRSCFAKWAEYENEDYEEKVCHACGERHKVTKAKPLCRTCFKATA